MAIKIDELIAIVGIDVDKSKMQNTEASLDKINKSFIGIKTAVFAATIAIFEFERRMIRGVAELGNSSKLLGIGSQEFQVLEFAAQKSGIALGSVTGAVSKLNDQLADVESHHKIPTELLQSLGQLSHFTGNKIDIFDTDGKLKEGYQLFKKISAEIKKLSPNEQLSFSNRFFGSNLIPALDKIEEARKELQGKGLLFSDKDIKDAEKVNAQFQLLGKSFDFLFKKAAISLSPVFEELLKAITDLTPSIIEAAKQFHSWISSAETRQGLRDLISALSTIANLIITITKFVGSVGSGIANIFTGAGVMGFEAQDKIENLLSRFSQKSFDNLVMKNPQSSQNNNTVNNTQNSNDNRVNNTTTNNNIMPTNMGAAYTLLTVR